MIGMGTKAEVYDAEMARLSWAARDAAHYATTTDPSIKHLHFYANNASAITIIFDPPTGPSRTGVLAVRLHRESRQAQEHGLRNTQLPTLNVARSEVHLRVSDSGLR